MSTIGTIIKHKAAQYVVISQAPGGYWVQLDSGTRNDVFDLVTLKEIRDNTVGHLVKGANYFTLKSGKAVEVMHQVGDTLFVRDTATKWKMVSEQEGQFLSEMIVLKKDADTVGFRLPVRAEFESLYDFIEAGREVIKSLAAEGLVTYA